MPGPKHLYQYAHVHVHVSNTTYKFVFMLQIVYYGQFFSPHKLKCMVIIISIVCHATLIGKQGGIFRCSDMHS